MISRGMVDLLICVVVLQVLIADSWAVCCNETWGTANLTKDFLHDIIVEYKQLRGAFVAYRSLVLLYFCHLIGLCVLFVRMLFEVCVHHACCVLDVCSFGV
jgi:hypothetical protein